MGGSDEEYLSDDIPDIEKNALAAPRCSEMEEKPQHTENKADNIRLDQQKDEEQNKKLEELIQRNKLLVADQQKELECQRQGEIMDTERFKEFMESVLPEGEGSKNTKELEDKLKSMEDQKLEFEEQLLNLQDENEFFCNSLNAVTQTQRIINDELEEARKLALTAIQYYGANDQLHRKKMGAINEEPWKEACRKIFETHPDGWHNVMQTKLSEWEDLVRDPNFEAFKTVQIGNTDRWKKVVNDNNQDLQKLREELGEEVYQTVITALTEIEDYDASGRCPVPVVWNFKKSRRATVGEVIEALVKKIKSLRPKKQGVKRSNANR